MRRLLPLQTLGFALLLSACAAPQPPAATPAGPASPAVAPLKTPSPGLPPPAAADKADAAPYGPAVAARFAEPAVRYDTPAFAAGRDDYTRNDELAAALDAIIAAPARGGTRVAGIDAGRSQQGVPVRALWYSRGGGRPVVMIIAQQHGDEPAGAEAALVVARDLATGRLADVLDRIDVVLLPRANPDGAGWASRVSANGLDINRDHLLLRTPEAQAQAMLALRFSPVVAVDMHEHTVVGRYLEKFGAVQRNDMLLQYAMTANYPEALTRASEQWFRQPLLAAMAAEGMTTEWYYTNPTPAGDLRLNMGGVQPDTGRNVQGLKNAISILLESRGVGIGKLHLGRRVHSHVVALGSILTSAARHADALAALQRQVGAEVAGQACGRAAMVLAGQTLEQRDFLMIDPQTGADTLRRVEWNSALVLRPLRERNRPCGYWIAADGAALVQRLVELGVQVRRLDRTASMRTEPWTEQSRREIPRPDVRGTAADAGLNIALVQVGLQPVTPLEAPAGSWYVPMDQPLGNLVFAALEPDTQNSYFANRLVDRLDAVRRVVAPPPR
ncbi:MAG: M14 family metallocarboxypeptidase [Aquabacterium sp.]